ncbi:DMT family transporter [uncultured Piscinibacter sp.]|uniref:DMT family transporter n=1 Tax=uncultured Piscinibacter sp. TaxID=1131835 RepID=UPI00262DA0B1|nr:DMT family transporter [uncultured Piscinibacter sp.]
MSEHAARERAALWAALALIVAWGANFSVQKEVFAALSPGGFLFVRYLIMPVAAAVLLLAHFGTRWPRLPRRELLALLKLGVAGHLLHVGLVTYGIHWSTAFSSSLILAMGPVFTLLILRWHGTEQLTRAQVAGVALAVVGVLVFLSDKLLGAQWQASGGDLTLLVAASFFSYYTVAAKPLIERHGGVVVMTYGTLLGSAPVVAISAAAGLQVDWGSVKPMIWLGTLYAVLIAAFLGWMVWGWVNAVRGVARTAPLMYLMPPVAALVAWAVTGERYTAIKLAGAAITLAGVALAQFASRSRPDLVRDSVPPVD